MLRNHFNEATLVFRREYGLTHHFTDAASSEGLSFTNDPSLSVDTDIKSIMICFSHQTNSVDKKPWLKQPIKMDMGAYARQLDILRAMV
jgi:hypothetical protein